MTTLCAIKFKTVNCLDADLKFSGLQPDCRGQGPKYGYDNTKKITFGNKNFKRIIIATEHVMLMRYQKCLPF